MKKSVVILSAIAMMCSCKQKELTQLDPSNPFAQEFSTYKQIPPFDQIKTEHYKPAFLAGMEQQTKEIEAIVMNGDAPTFDNTIVALEESGKLLDRVSGVFFSITEANADSTIQAISAEISPMLAEHSDNIFLNEPLFQRVKTVYEAPESKDLTLEQQRLTEHFYKRFVRAGVDLNPTEKAWLRSINKELTSLELKFSENLLAETNNFQLIIDNPSDLSGLPADAVEVAANTAKSAGLEGKWVFTLSKPSWVPFLQYADNRDLREKLYKAMYNRCNNGNEYDNNEIITKIVNLRLEKAQVLGYPSYAAYALEETMAKTPDNAMKLLEDIWKYALPQAKKEKAELQQLIVAEGKDFELQSWDWWYYAEKLRAKKYDLNEEELRPYFVLENVRDGAFAVANKLYGITFKELADVPVYQKDVKAFEVSDVDGSYLGIIYLDYFPRPEKRNGAWMGNFAEQCVSPTGDTIRPIVYNVGNFALPAANTPSLLTVDQAETLFHEFGHALHGLLSKCTYESLSGTNVYRDFVELPSQINEHWAFHPEVLKMYAKHYQTAAVIPDDLIKKMQNASYFNQGFTTTELLAAAILDMKWHSIESPLDVDAQTFEKNVLDGIGLIPEIIVRYKSPYFAHIFSGSSGYSAGYYSYLWAEVLDADAFNSFETHGIFDHATAQSFRDNILSKGSTEDPAELYRKFRGADPNPKYLLKNRGFIQ